MRPSRWPPQQSDPTPATRSLVDGQRLAERSAARSTSRRLAGALCAPGALRTRAAAAKRFPVATAEGFEVFCARPRCGHAASLVGAAPFAFAHPGRTLCAGRTRTPVIFVARRRWRRPPRIRCDGSGVFFVDDGSGFFGARAVEHGRNAVCPHRHLAPRCRIWCDISRHCRIGCLTDGRFATRPLSFAWRGGVLRRRTRTSEGQQRETGERKSKTHREASR
jgi:hypothetical protein